MSGSWQLGSLPPVPYFPNPTDSIQLIQNKELLYCACVVDTGA